VCLAGLLLAGAVAAASAAADSTAANAAPAAPDPQALYQQALRALAQDQPEHARTLLEQVVALQPHFAGAWLDLALASYRSGDAAAAVEHLEYLRSQFGLPPLLAGQVNLWLHQWQTAPQADDPLASPSAPPGVTRPTPGWYGELALGIGHDSNANAGLASQRIPISLPEGSTDFDLDGSYQPRADGFSLQSLTLGGPSQALLAGRLAPVLFVRSKQLSTEHAYSTLDLQPGLIYIQPAGPGASWQAYLLAQHYRLGGQTLYNGARLALQRNQAIADACQTNTSGQIELRQHQQVPSQSASLYSASATLVCRLPGTGGYLSAGLKAAWDLARADRAGGDNRSAEISASVDQPLNPRQSLQLGWLYSRITDQTGYSPLLQNNAVRHLQQRTYSLTLRHTLSPAWQAKASLEYFAQTSNLPLFTHQGTQFSAALSYRFD